MKEVGDDHVVVGAGLLVEAGAGVDGERFGHLDLDVIDVVAVPDRLEHAVGEAQRDEVVHRLATEEVVDAKHALLGEDGVDEPVEAPGAVEVGAERLLEDHPGVLGQATVADRLHDLAGGARRDGEAVQAPRGASELTLGVLHGLLERLCLLEAERGGGQAAREACPGLGVCCLVADRGAREGAEVVVGALAAGGADDAEPVGHEPGPGQVKEPGKELASREVAAGAEQDDDVVIGNVLSGVEDLGSLGSAR
ncbi:MAG: hypothetical protein M3155_07760 [Actinomycetota bacterium]|nr:hypothetical protein [Actinomycetota bacterium]